MKDKNWINQVGADGCTFGERLKWLLTSRSVTAKQLAAATGIAESAISNYQRDPHLYKGRCPSSDVVLELARYFSVSTDYLYGLTPASSANPCIAKICEYTGLSEASVNILHSYPHGSLQSNFLRRFFDDLLVEHGIATNVPKAILRYAYIEKTAIHENQSLVKKPQKEISRLNDGRFSIPTADAAEMYRGIAIAEAQGSIESVIDSMCEEALRSTSIGMPDLNTLRNYRWEIYSEDERLHDIDWLEWNSK